MTPTDAYRIVQLAREEEERLRVVRVAATNKRHEAHATRAYTWFSIVALVAIMLIALSKHLWSKRATDQASTIILILLAPMTFLAVEGVRTNVHKVSLTLANLVPIVIATFYPVLFNDLDVLHWIPIMTVFFGIAELMLASGFQF